MNLTLYTNPMSRGRMARWMLEEIGAPYSTVLLSYGPEMDTARYRALNPMGKVPTLVHDDHVVTECAAVIAYLAEAFPQAGLAGQDRGAFLRWMFFGAGPFEAAVTNRALGVEVTPEKSGFVGYGSFDRVIDTLESALCTQHYLAGDAFSAADLYVGSQIGYGLAFTTLPARPALVAFWDRIKDRPARLRAAALDDADLAKEKTQ